MLGPHLIHITVKCIFVPGFPRSNYWDTKGTVKQERLGISASHYQPDLHYTLLKVWTCVALVFCRVLTGNLYKGKSPEHGKFGGVILGPYCPGLPGNTTPGSRSYFRRNLQW